MTSQLVVDAVEQLNRIRKRDGKDLTSLITHHDHRSQYLSVANTKHLDAAHLDAAKIKPSTGAVGSSYDNAFAESSTSSTKPSSSSPRVLEGPREPQDHDRRIDRQVQPSPPAHLRQPHTRRSQSDLPRPPPEPSNRRRLKLESLRTRQEVQNAERGNQLVVAPFREVVSGDVLLSHTVSRAVPLALKGLASGFGMEPGVSLSLWSPKLYGDTGTPLGTARPVNGCAVVGVPDRISGTAQWTRVPPLRVGSSLCSSPRPISTGQLHVLPRFHFLPINPVVSPGALPG